MDENLFKKRTKQLALRVIKVVNALPRKSDRGCARSTVDPIWHFDWRQLSSSVSREVHSGCDRQASDR